MNIGIDIDGVLMDDDTYRLLTLNNMTRVFSWYDIYRKIKQV